LWLPMSNFFLFTPDSSDVRVNPGKEFFFEEEIDTISFRFRFLVV